MVADLMAPRQAWRHLDPVLFFHMGKQEKEAWTLRVKEGAKMEAYEHQGLDQFLQGPGQEVSMPTIIPPSKAKPPEKFS